MLNYAGFLLIILLANIIQGITGFAGTILAMPPSLMLVGYGTAKPILNVLGLLSGIYVFVGNNKSVRWDELKKIVAVMSVGILAGIALKGYFTDKEPLLYKLLGVFIVFLSVQGGWKLFTKKAERDRNDLENRDESEPGNPLGLLGLAGIVHGLFVSGGPVLIGYLTGRIPDKVSFRATISTVWVILNTIILLDDIRTGLWNRELIRLQMVSVPFLLAGMFLGGKLYARMSQRLFMGITYGLLFISGVSLLVK